MNGDSEGREMNRKKVRPPRPLGLSRFLAVSLKASTEEHGDASASLLLYLGFLFWLQAEAVTP